MLFGPMKREVTLLLHLRFQMGQFTSHQWNQTAAVLYKIDADDGSLIWSCEIPYVIAQDRGKDMHASPTVGEGMVFVAANKQNYYG